MRKRGGAFIHPFITPWQRKELARRRAANKVAKRSRKVNR